MSLILYLHSCLFSNETWNIRKLLALNHEVFIVLRALSYETP